MNRQEWLLTQFISELAEVQHRATKLQQFGRDEVQPGQELTNKQRLEGEWADLIAVAELLNRVGVLDTNSVTREAIKAKEVKVAGMMNYAVQCGTLDLNL